MGVREYHTKIKMGTGIKWEQGIRHQELHYYRIYKFFPPCFLQPSFFFCSLSFWHTYLLCLDHHLHSDCHHNVSITYIFSLPVSSLISVYIISYRCSFGVVSFVHVLYNIGLIDCLLGWLATVTPRISQKRLIGGCHII